MTCVEREYKKSQPIRPKDKDQTLRTKVHLVNTLHLPVSVVVSSVAEIILDVATLEPTRCSQQYLPFLLLNSVEWRERMYKDHQLITETLRNLPRKERTNTGNDVILEEYRAHRGAAFSTIFNSNPAQASVWTSRETSRMVMSILSSSHILHLINDLSTVTLRPKSHSQPSPKP